MRLIPSMDNTRTFYIPGSEALDYLEDDSEGTEGITKGNELKSKEIPNEGI